MKKTYQEQAIVKEWAVQALLKLIGQIPYSQITVIDITKRAGIPRSTFYRYFENKDDVLKNYFVYLVECLTAEFRKYKHITYRQLIQIQFEFFEKYNAYFKALKKIHREYIIFEHIRDEIERINYDQKDKAYLTYQSISLYTVLFEWVVQDNRESIDVITEIVVHLTDIKTIQKAFPVYIQEYNKL